MSNICSYCKDVCKLKSLNEYILNEKDQPTDIIIVENNEILKNFRITKWYYAFYHNNYDMSNIIFILKNDTIIKAVYANDLFQLNIMNEKLLLLKNNIINEIKNHH
jgi:hypothetical protein